MSNPTLFVPVVVLAFWTLVVLLLVPFSRAHRRADADAAAPPPVNVPNRNFMNLLEVPVLFYVGCLVLFVTGGASYVAVVLAWIYVALRIVHSAIHLTYNRIAHRGAAFAASNVVVVALWVVVAVHVLNAAAIPR